MNEVANVIPLESRRRSKRVSSSPPPPGQAPHAAIADAARRRGSTAFCVGLFAICTTLVMVDRSSVAHQRPSQAGPVAALLASESAGLYERTVTDITATCALRAARSGVLRQHCVQQALFVQRLPQCTGECARLARAVLGSDR